MDNLVRDIKLRELVISQLENFQKRVTSDEIIICCPFHNDTKPSLRIHIGHKVVPGSFHCFGCGRSSNWNELARALKLKTFDFKEKRKFEDNDNPALLLAEEFNKYLNEDSIPTLKGLEPLPDNFSWRGYNKYFYKSLGAKFYWNKEKDLEYLYFPLNMNSFYKGYTLCALNRDLTEDKYLIYGKAKDIFFLYDYIPHSEPIVLVEGHFDAIRLYAEGLYPLGIFGIENWCRLKKQLLIAKAPPKVVIAFDGDDAGYKASIRIFNDLRDGFDIGIFYLPLVNPKLDPGNMSYDHVMQLKEMLYG